MGVLVALMGLSGLYTVMALVNTVVISSAERKREFATGWERCLTGLRDVLAGAEPTWSGRGVERHEALVARFKLDRPEVTRTDSGWHVRFERQLTCPAETAWDLFFDLDLANGEQLRVPAVGGEFRPSRAPEVLLGIATEVDAPRTFAFDVADGEPGDAVRLRLGEGTGHGTRSSPREPS